MPVIQIATPFNIDIEFETAEFHKRLFAYGIDFFLIWLYLYFSRRLFFETIEVGETSYGLVLIVVLLPMLFYTLISETVWGGQTLGKKVMGLKVVSLDGGEPTFGQFLLRWFMRFYEWGFIIFSLFWGNGLVGVGFLFLGGVTSIMIIVINAKNQRLGDIVAGTVVVNTHSKLTVHDTIFQHVRQENYVVSFPEVMKLSDRDINTIKNVLVQSQKTNRYDMCNRVAFKVQEVLKVSTDMYAHDFLEKIMEDYNYLATRE